MLLNEKKYVVKAKYRTTHEISDSKDGGVSVDRITYVIRLEPDAGPLSESLAVSQEIFESVQVGDVVVNSYTVTNEEKAVS